MKDRKFSNCRGIYFNNEESDNKEPSDESNNNGEKDKEKNIPNNGTIIIINCLNNICKVNEVDDPNENNGENGISCENGKCIFIPEEIENEKGDDDTKKKNLKRYIYIGVIIIWIICIFLNFIFIFACGGISCANCKCSCYVFYTFFIAIIFSPFFMVYFLFFVCCSKCDCCCSKCDCCSPSSLVFFNNKSDANTQNNIPSEKGPVYLSKNKRIPSEIIKLKNDNQTEIDEEEREIKIEKKKIYIQKHSSPCDIELVDGDYYLINNEEVKIILMLYHSLKLISKSISIYTFNIAQFNLIKKKLENELLYINVVLLNEDCTNFIYSEYIIISFIESKISKESRKKYPSFETKLNSRKFYTDEFANNILNEYTGKYLYLICNDDYLKKSNISLNESISSSESNITNSVKAHEIQVPVVNRKYVTNEYNICFIIDNTGSMDQWINIIKDICHNFFVEITQKFSEYKFYFGCVLYADEPSTKKDKNYPINFTQDEKKFKSELANIQLQSGGDEAEDWVGGFKVALEDLTWGNGTKLIFHIADAPQHGKHFNTDKKGDDFLNDENDKYGKDLIQLIKKCSERNIKITGISINNVCSFKVFKEEYEKVDGPKYEIIDIKGEELKKGSDYMNKKMFNIIENCINQNKAENFI